MYQNISFEKKEDSIMTLSEANLILDLVKQGMEFNTYKINQALVLTGDLSTQEAK